MAPSPTPETDKWEDLHARACKAEREVVMAALGYITAGTALPTELARQTANSLRAMATAQYDLAVAELLRISKRQAFGSTLVTGQHGDGGGTGGAHT